MNRFAVPKGVVRCGIPGEAQLPIDPGEGNQYARMPSKESIRS
jgi:hypothetical protein